MVLSSTIFSRKKSKICKIGDFGVVELHFLFIFAKKFLKNLLIWRRSSILKITCFSEKFAYFYCLIFNINLLLKRKFKKKFLFKILSSWFSEKRTYKKKSILWNFSNHSKNDWKLLGIVKNGEIWSFCEKISPIKVFFDTHISFKNAIFRCSESSISAGFVR